MAWTVEYTGEFFDWWQTLEASRQGQVAKGVRLLESKGPRLPFPYSSGSRGSRHPHMRELRIQSQGDPIRIFYAFDPRRAAILLIGGDKAGEDRFYKVMVPLADRLYDTYLEELRREGLIP